MRVLFVAARFPFPPWRGDQARAFHQICHLARRHRLTLLAPARGATAAGREALRATGAEVVTVASLPWAALLGAARSARRGEPWQAGLFATRALRQRLAALLAERRHDLVHVQLVRGAAALPRRLELPLCVDLIDALSQNLRRRSERQRGPLGLLLASEAERLLLFERALCGRAQRLSVVSAADREAIGDFPNLHVNRNGVDLERWHPPDGPRDPRLLVFSGNLGYFPSVDAVRTLVREVMPRVWRDEAQTRLALVGARPAREVRRLASRDARVALHADVADVQPFLAQASVAVLPLRAGSGQLFKTLEAMACATPVVATPQALAGLDVEPDRHVLAGETADDLARAALGLLRDPERAARLGQAGRDYVAGRHSWDVATSELEALWEQAVADYPAPTTSA